MRRLFIAVLATWLVTPALALAQPGAQVRKPVVSIDDIQDLAHTGQAAVLRQMIETTVVNTGKFRIMERNAQGMSVLLGEQQRAKSGLVTSNTPGKVGGFEHLILMGRSGFMTHAEAEKGIRMFGKEVLPRLKEVKHAPVD